ncbi:oncoprotein-induced transcript 3 protein-like [Mytilus trossulus]|uniref:oncoprotein-induced transcript 3 protein-like n=1 Tax=Mytilus trossulus TaxID=6551 RepID=UPI0030046CA9
MFWIIVCLIFPYAFGQDPCSDSGTGTISRNILDVPFCDASLNPIWYKIDEKTGEDIYTECVTFGTCGTVYPLWMDGSIPETSEGIVDRNVCQVTPGNCCNRTYAIQVKNCGDFRVYKLTFTYGCYQAYCFKASDEVTDCTEKGNFKCGGGNTKVLIAVSLVVVFGVLIVGTIVWCYFRRRPSLMRKPILANENTNNRNSQPPIVHINEPANHFSAESVM